MGQLIDFLLRHPLLVGATGLAIIATIVMELRLRSQSSFAVAAHHLAHPESLSEHQSTLLDALQELERSAHRWGRPS